MKSEQEFINSIWADINTQELEAEQIKHAQKISKQLFFTEMLAYGIVLALFVAEVLIVILIKDNSEISYMAGILLFLVAISAERLFYSKPKGEYINEN